MLPQKEVFGCLMLYLSSNDRSNILNIINDIIAPEELYKDSIESIEQESHVTLFYGFDKEFDYTKLDKTVLASILNVDYLIIGELKCFQCPEFDVIVLDCSNNQNLFLVNKTIKKEFKIESSVYKDYHPHLTLAYVKPGLGNFIMDRFSQKTYGLAKISDIVYSLSEYGKYKFTGRSWVPYKPAKNIIDLKTTLTIF